MADIIFGGANYAEFYEWDGSAVGSLLHTCENIIDSDFPRQADLSWNATLNQEEDTPDIYTFIEAAINADSSGGGAAADRKYEDGASAPTPAASGSTSEVLVVGVFYGGVTASGMRKILIGFFKMLSSSGSYKQADQTPTSPTLAFASVAAPIAVDFGSAGDITLSATYAASAATATLASGSKGKVVHVAKQT